MDNKELLQAIKEMIQEEIKPIKRELSSIKSGMATKEDISRLESKIDNIAYEGDENVNTILFKHIATTDKTLTTLATKKDIDNLATKEDLTDINSHLEVLNERLFHQEATLKHLKAVK